MDQTVDDTFHQPMDRDRGSQQTAAWLRVVHPPGLDVAVRLEQEAIVLGRRPDRGVRLPHQTVSRNHISLEFNPTTGGHECRDLGSTNGSRVDGSKLVSEVAPLSDGSVIRVGDVIAVYELEPHAANAEAPGVSKEAIFGESLKIRRLRTDVARAASDPSPILLVGETGTGKEYVAREIHRLSGRRGAFLAINCAALSPQLVESQLFGHAKGAFTGAQGAYEGLFRAANGGTLFLDEVGELPVALQPKLLRVLQEGEVHPVGVSHPVRVDVRIVSATLRDLASVAGGDRQEGGFRLDLYARLSPWEIRVPSLRERRSDVLRWFTRLREAWYAERNLEPPPEFAVDAEDAEQLLMSDWRDNLRGLDRLVHRACGEAGRPMADVLADFASASVRGADARSHDGRLVSRTTDRQLAESPRIGPENPPTSESAGSPSTPPAAKPPKPTRDELLEVLEAHGGSVRRTAKHYDRDRRQIYRWMDQFGIRDKS